MSKTSLVNRADRDPVSTVLKWVLLVVGFATAMLLFWTTLRTYQGVPPQPQRFVSRSGDVIMTADDIIAGKGGFQKADLMDYGSLYGMGSYYGEDYTASLLKNIALSTRENYAHDVGERTFSHLSPEKQTVATTHMREDLRGIDLTQDTVVLPDAVSHAFVKIRDETAASFLRTDRSSGWNATQALTPALALKTADFLMYSALTTVAHRPGETYSWTQNWPYEPLVGNTPTGATFIWTWASFGFVFLAFGVVLFIYEYWLDDADTSLRECILVPARPLTSSQRKIWKYFLLVYPLWTQRLFRSVSLDTKKD